MTVDAARLRDCTIELVSARRRLAAGPTAAEDTALRARIKDLSHEIVGLSGLAMADAAHQEGYFEDEAMIRAALAQKYGKADKMMTYDRMGPLPGNAELRRGAADDSGAATGGAKVLIQRLPRTAASYTIEGLTDGSGGAGVYEWSTTAAGPGDTGRNFRPTRESTMSGTAAEQIFDGLATTEEEKAQSIFDRSRQYERTSDAAKWRQSSMQRASDEAVQRRAIHNRNLLNRRKYGYDGPGAA
jgi:hypothetical protein